MVDSSVIKDELVKKIYVADKELHEWPKLNKRRDSRNHERGESIINIKDEELIEELKLVVNVSYYNSGDEHFQKFSFVLMYGGIPAIRWDNYKPHRNPDGTIVPAPHKHFSEIGKTFTWAYQVDDIPQDKGVDVALYAFLKECNVKCYSVPLIVSSSLDG